MAILCSTEGFRGKKSANHLLIVSMLNIPVLRSGLSVLLTQYFVIAAIFFVMLVYLQVVLGYAAIHAVVKLLPLSVGLIIFLVAGSRAVKKYSPKRIVRAGELLLLYRSILPNLL